MSEQAKLIMQGGPNDGREYLLEEGAITLGRRKGNTVRSGWDGHVSGRHARITGKAGLFWLEDVGSRNGTFLTEGNRSEEKLAAKTPTLLLDGARFRFGLYTRYQVVGVVTSDSEALHKLRKTLQKQLKALRKGLPHLSPEKQTRQREQLAAFAKQLETAPDEADVLRLAAEGIPTLSIPQNQPHPPDANDNYDNSPSPAAEEHDFPAWDDIPDPQNPTPRNILLRDIYSLFPELAEDEGGGSEE